MSVAVKGTRTESNQPQRLPMEKEPVRGAPNFIGVRHIGLPAKDPAALAVFYRDVMGMKIMRRVQPTPPMARPRSSLVTPKKRIMTSSSSRTDRWHTQLSGSHR